MRDQTENEAPEEAQAPDPYGDVALGVECAWPERLALTHPAPTPAEQPG